MLRPGQAVQSRCVFHDTKFCQLVAALSFDRSTTVSSFNINATKRFKFDTLYWLFTIWTRTVGKITL